MLSKEIQDYYDRKFFGPPKVTKIEDIYDVKKLVDDLSKGYMPNPEGYFKKNEEV